MNTKRRTTGQPSPKPEFRDEASPTLAEQIEIYISSVNAGVENVPDPGEMTPEELGAIDNGLDRLKLIQSALTLSIARTLRSCKRNSPRTIAYLHYVAIMSDNVHGRCLDSAGRMSEYFDCGEDVVRDTRSALVACGALRSELRPGRPAAVWLPYSATCQQNSAFAILKQIAPPRTSPGRPKKTSGVRHPASTEKTPGLGHPTISEKPQVLKDKTLGVCAKTSGHLTPDCKNSIQELNSSTQGGQRLRQTSPPRFQLVKWEVNRTEGSSF
jgi:hypothetical protein